MRGITLNANAKINLGLDVLGVREDGYHEVRMIMQSLELSDEIVLEKTEGEIVIRTDSTEIPSDQNNLCYKAAALMKREYGIEQGVTVTVTKRIPVAAGLAGGSADAAAVMTGMNDLFGLSLSKEQLMEQGVRIGADVPFCIMKGCALSEGIGEKLTGLKNLPKCGIILFTPKISVSTAAVYKKLDLLKALAHPDIDGMLEAIDSGDLKRLAGLMKNVLEQVTASEYGVISETEERFMENGALGAVMSGSGPTVFGIFGDRRSAEAAYETLRTQMPEGQLILTEPAGKGGIHGGS